MIILIIIFFDKINNCLNNYINNQTWSKGVDFNCAPNRTDSTLQRTATVPTRYTLQSASATCDYYN